MRTRLNQLLVAGPTGGWKRRLAALASSIALAGGLALAQSKPDTASLKVGPIAIDVQPILSFDKDGSSRSRYGKLEWRGGLVLSSSSVNFGGWSGLAFDGDSKRFCVISDAGTWMTAELVYDGRRPLSIASAKIGPLRARDGRTLRSRRDRDAEAVVLEDGSLENGTLLIAFEQHGRIGRFPVAKGEVAAPTAYLEIPAEIRAMRGDGFEAVTVLRGGKLKGSVVAFAERPLAGETDRTGWIWVGGGPKKFTFQDVSGFDVTDAAGLADGSLLVLERRFKWSEGVKMRLRLIDAADLKPGAVIKGEVLIAADLGQEIDNMEGLAVRERANGETLITMISDDNFNKLLQRTVLLEFALARDAKPHAAEGPPAAAPEDEAANARSLAPGGDR